MRYVITDNCIQAKMDYPDLEAVGSAHRAMTLKKGSEVIIKRYCVGKPHSDPCTAAAALVRNGTYREVQDDN